MCLHALHAVHALACACMALHCITPPSFTVHCSSALDRLTVHCITRGKSSPSSISCAELTGAGVACGGRRLWVEGGGGRTGFADTSLQGEWHRNGILQG